MRSFVLTRVTQSVLSGCHSMTDVADRAELLRERHVSLNRYMYVSLTTRQAQHRHQQLAEITLTVHYAFRI